MSAAPIDLISLHHVESHREPDLYAQQMRAVAEQRDQWLAGGLCTDPSDRSAAESAVVQLYRRVRLPEPQFVWVPSPPAGSRLIADEGLSETHSIAGGDVADGSTRITALIVDSRRRMDARITHEGAGGRTRAGRSTSHGPGRPRTLRATALALIRSCVPRCGTLCAPVSSTELRRQFVP